MNERFYFRQLLAGRDFAVGDAVEVTAGGALFAKGLARCSSSELARHGDGTPVPRDVVVVHHDDLVALD